MAISNDFQFEYTNPRGDSILMGALTDYDVTDVRGLGMPSVRANDVGRLDADGSITSRKELLSARTINLRINVIGTPGDDLDSKLTSLFLAVQANDSPGTLSFQWPMGYGSTVTSEDTRFITAYVRQVTKSVVASNAAGVVPVYIQLEASNPLIHRTTQNSETIALASFVGGLEFPDTFPATFGTGSSLSTTVNNAGNFAAYPTVRFMGPVTAPKIRIEGLGKWIELAGLTVASGSYCEVDFYERSILLNGSSSQYNKLTSASEWFTLPPGTSYVTYSASSSSAVNCFFKWYDTWI